MNKRKWKSLVFNIMVLKIDWKSSEICGLHSERDAWRRHFTDTENLPQNKVEENIETVKQLKGTLKGRFRFHLIKEHFLLCNKESLTQVPNDKILAAAWNSFYLFEFKVSIPASPVLIKLSKLFLWLETHLDLQMFGISTKSESILTKLNFVTGFYK